MDRPSLRDAWMHLKNRIREGRKEGLKGLKGRQCMKSTRLIPSRVKRAVRITERANERAVRSERMSERCEQSSEGANALNS